MMMMMIGILKGISIYMRNIEIFPIIVVGTYWREYVVVVISFVVVI